MKTACAVKAVVIFAVVAALGQVEASGQPQQARAGATSAVTGLEWLAQAPALPPPKEGVIRVTNSDELLASVNQLRSGGTVLLENGTYRLPRVLRLDGKTNVAIRSASGDPTRVIVTGDGWEHGNKNEDLLHIARCQGVLIADITFADCRSYGIKVEAENGPRDVHIYNCRFRDIGTRAIKGSAGKNPSVRAVKGSVRYCRFENTKVPPADWLFGGDYIAGIDMMALEDWTFSDNFFRNIRGRNGAGRAAIFVWVRSRQILVERNVIVDCDRGIAFGNPGQSTANSAGAIPAYVSEGVIRNNFISGGADCGIELWYADGIRILHNSIWRPERNWARGIRVGRGTVRTQIVNNLVHGEIREEGGIALMRQNVSGPLDGYFLNPSSGNLALTAAATQAIDQAVVRADVSDDIRGTNRMGRADLGAWELKPGDLR